MARKRQSTKNRIVKAAWNLFYKNGYDHTTVEEIIAASKTSKDLKRDFLPLLQGQRSFIKFFIRFI